MLTAQADVKAMLGNLLNAANRCEDDKRKNQRKVFDHALALKLNMTWLRRAKLVFTFHGLGRQFNGSLVCAPFLEFIDEDDDGAKRTTLVPVAEEAFVFFYTEDEHAVITRFEPWRERVLTIALQELSQNL